MIEKGYTQNFETLRRAFHNKDVCLAECTDAKTGARVIAVCAVERDRIGDFILTPLAKMFDGNPYEELLPPQAPQVNERSANG